MNHSKDKALPLFDSNYSENKNNYLILLSSCPHPFSCTKKQNFASARKTPFYLVGILAYQQGCQTLMTAVGLSEKYQWCSADDVLSESLSPWQQNLQWWGIWIQVSSSASISLTFASSSMQGTRGYRSWSFFCCPRIQPHIRKLWRPLLTLLNFVSWAILGAHCCFIFIFIFAWPTIVL